MEPSDGAGSPPTELMAARRLLIVMLVLLGISTLAAALVPPRSEREGTPGTTTGPREDDETEGRPRGEALSATVTLDRDRVSVVPIRLGDQLSLTVNGPRPDQIEIPAFGLSEPVASGAPARFELLPREPGSYGVRSSGADRVVARIEVRPRAPGASARARGADRRGGPRS